MNESCVCIGTHVPAHVSRDGPYSVGTLNMGPEILRYRATALPHSPSPVRTGSMKRDVILGRFPAATANTGEYSVHYAR
jgi:hypothetical protein